MFGEMLEGFERLRPEEFGLDDARYAQVTCDVDHWRKRAIKLARQRELERDRRLDLGHEL